MPQKKSPADRQRETFVKRNREIERLRRTKQITRERAAREFAYNAAEFVFGKNRYPYCEELLAGLATMYAICMHYEFEECRERIESMFAPNGKEIQK